MKQDEQGKIKSLRILYAGIAAVSALGMIAVLFLDNWGEHMYWLVIILSAFLSGKFEKNDELAKINIGKANSLTMWFLFAALVYCAMYARFHPVSPAKIMIIIFLALIIRSILFLIFDMTDFGEKETDV